MMMVELAEVVNALGNLVEVNMGYVAAGPEAVKMMRLIALKSAVGLEAKGIRMSRRSMRTQACRELGLPLRTKHGVVQERIQEVIDEMASRGIGFEKIGG